MTHDRPTRLDVLMGTAYLFAQRSTCNRLRVGAILTRDGRVLSTGYNGPPKGMPHCDHQNDAPCDLAIHAEANVIAFSARHGVATERAELIVTHQPCLKCAHLIVNAGIKLVTYDEEYRDRAGVDLLSSLGVPCVKYPTRVDTGV